MIILWLTPPSILAYKFVAVKERGGRRLTPAQKLAVWFMAASVCLPIEIGFLGAMVLLLALLGLIL